MNVKAVAAAFIISLVIVGGLCFYAGTAVDDDGDGPHDEGLKLSTRTVQIGDTVGMVCSFPKTSNDTVYAEATVVAYENGNYAISVIAEGNTRVMTVSEEDFILEYPEESMHYFGQDTITTAFGEIECEVYSIDHQGSQMRVWYHDGIGLRVDTTIDGMKVVIDRVSISFVTSDA